MPVEPIGLAISVVGLVGLFTSCLDLLDAVSSLKTHGVAYQDLTCMFEVEKVLLLKWGEAVGLLHNPNLTAAQQRYSQHLKDERILNSVAQTLSCLKRKFENAGSLVTKYGVRYQPTIEDRYGYLGNSTHTTFETIHEKQQSILKRVQSEASLTMKARWAIHDRTKLSDLMNDIRKLSGDLRRLVPVYVVGCSEVENRVRFEIANGSSVGKAPTQHVAFDTAENQSSKFLEYDTGVIHVYDWLEHVASEYTTDQSSYRSVKTSAESNNSNNTIYSFSLQETQSISIKTRVGSNISSYSTFCNRFEQQMRDRMDEMFFTFCVYVAIFSTIIIVNVLLLKLM